MAVVSRNGRPNRTNVTRGARTGVVALLALGAGVGCGQAMLRPQSGPGLAAQALGLADDVIPGAGMLLWDDLASPGAGRGPSPRSR